MLQPSVIVYKWQFAVTPVGTAGAAPSSLCCESFLWAVCLAVKSVQTKSTELFVCVLVNMMSTFLKNNFCVISSTVRDLGLNPLGEDTGTAEVLSQVIIERMLWFYTPTVKAYRKCVTVLMTHTTLYLTFILGEDTNIPPLFFPCGSIKREVLPTALKDNGKHFLLLCRAIKPQSDKGPTGV